MKKTDIKKINEVANELGWTMSVNNENNEKEITFEKYSPAGQDFFFSITANDLEEVVEEVCDRCNNFDCSEETYLWLDNTGHGQNGAPYDMKNLYEDMEACLEMMELFHDELKKLI